MVPKDALIEIAPFLFEIPRSFRADMRVPARLFASRELLDAAFHDKTLQQLVNVTTLPGIQGAALAMPDAHEGYGFPIGGVAATLYPDGVISPGGIGYDINCGVRLLKSDLHYDEVASRLKRLSELLYEWIPSGVGRGGKMVFEGQAMDELLSHGAPFLVGKGYGYAEDLDHIESRGCLEGANPAMVSQRAKQRGRDQVGTMGAGNHFVEVDYVEEIYNEAAAKKMGLFQKQIVILIHTGSRGLGHQVATDYIKLMNEVMPRYHIELPDPELACVPFNSDEGSRYFQAMQAAANFAWANRQMITHEARSAWKEVFGQENRLSLLYDVAHNIAKVEEYSVDHEKKKLIVHRKGATRAFVDQPVLIPGSMGTSSYVLVGAQESLRLSFGSTCHGAGRALSRHAAKKRVHGKALLHDLESAHIHVQAGSMMGLAEEAPCAYKDVDAVVNVVDQAGIALKVAKLKPCCVIKG